MNEVITSVYCSDDRHWLCRPDREQCECPCHQEDRSFDGFLRRAVADCVEAR